MKKFKLQYKPFGEHSILIEWPQIISENVLKSVLLYKQKLENFEFKQKVYIKHAYNSILVSYSSTINNIYDEILTLKSILYEGFDSEHNDSILWKVPVCYDLEFGLDLEEISLKNNLEISKIIELHTNENYLVYFIGFLPGFLYLGGLDKKIHFPRKSTPRMQIEKGAVAIGGSQTGIYPNESPGGWNIIGSTPIEFFNVQKENPCFAKAGDKIQFISVSKVDYDQIASSIATHDYIIESEVIDD